MCRRLGDCIVGKANLVRSGSAFSSTTSCPSHDLGVEGRSSDVSSRIYCDIQKLGRKIGFRYGTAKLEMDVVVASLLMAGDDTVVLEVMLESELPTRAFAVTPVVSGTATDSTDPKRTPLPDVTKHGFGSFETGQREA